MTWLLVLSGTWGYGHPTTRTMVSYPAGLYLDVDDVTVDFVRRANSPQLVLGEGEPPEYRLNVAPPGVPLQVVHLRVPHDGRIVLAQPETIEEIAEAQGDDRPLTFPCPHCEARFPHAAPLRRHLERSHADSPEVSPPPPPPEDPVEPALTDALALPADLGARTPGLGLDPVV